MSEGITAIKRGDYVRAARAFEEVLSRNKNDTDALHQMGAIAIVRGLPAEAALHFERLSRIKPRDAGALVNLGKARFASGDARGAILAIDRALAIDADMAPALATRADALNRLGRADEAIDSLRPIVGRGSESAEIAHTFAVLLAQAGRHEEAAAIASRHFESKSVIDPLLRRMLGFALGQSLDAMGDVERAFDAFASANAVAVSGPRFNPDAFVREVDEQIAYFTSQRMRGLIRASVRSPLPVLVTGVARSGTTLIEQIIHAHPQGFGAGELPDIDRLAAEVGGRIGSTMIYPNCLFEISESLANELATEYVTHLSKLGPHAARVVDKNLHAVMHLGLVWQLLPGGSVIHCRRDPIANGLSCYISALSPRLHPYASDLTHIGLVIRQFERIASHWKHVLDLNMIEVQYEDVVANQETESRRIISHIGLEWDDACLRFHQAERVVRTLSYDQVRRPIYTTAIDRHARYEKFLGPLRDALKA